MVTSSKAGAVFILVMSFAYPTKSISTALPSLITSHFLSANSIPWFNASWADSNTFIFTYSLKLPFPSSSSVSTSPSADFNLRLFK